MTNRTQQERPRVHTEGMETTTPRWLLGEPYPYTSTWAFLETSLGLKFWMEMMLRNAAFDLYLTHKYDALDIGHAFVRYGELMLEDFDLLVGTAGVV